jgi:hypothetical protein
MPKPVSKGMGVVSAVLIAVGTIVSRTNMMLRVVNSARTNIGRRKSLALRAMSWVAFFMMLFIFFGYAVMKKDSSYAPSLNYILAPFGFLFFYMGRWCVFMAGASYKRVGKRTRR